MWFERVSLGSCKIQIKLFRQRIGTERALQFMYLHVDGETYWKKPLAFSWTIQTPSRCELKLQWILGLIFSIQCKNLENVRSSFKWVLHVFVTMAYSEPFEQIEKITQKKTHHFVIALEFLELQQKKFPRIHQQKLKCAIIPLMSVWSHLKWDATFIGFFGHLIKTLKIEWCLSEVAKLKFKAHQVFTADKKATLTMHFYSSKIKANGKSFVKGHWANVSDNVFFHSNVAFGANQI